MKVHGGDPKRQEKRIQFAVSKTEKDRSKIEKDGEL